MALLDQIKNQLGSPEQPTTPTGGQTQTVRDLLRAKTGKVVAPSSGPRQSSLQEKSAEAATQAGQQQLGLRGQLQAAQIGAREEDIEQRDRQQEQQFQESWTGAQENMSRQANQLLSQFESGQKSLNTSQDIAAIEQIGFQARLQNDQYLNQLQNEGKTKRLDNQLEFKKELARTVFADQQELLVNDLSFNRIMAADDREFAEELASMDIDYAMQVAENSAKARSAQQVTQGIGSAVTGGIQAGAAAGIFNSTSGASPGASGAANTETLAMNISGAPTTIGIA